VKSNKSRIAETLASQAIKKGLPQDDSHECFSLAAACRKPQHLNESVMIGC